MDPELLSERLVPWFAEHARELPWREQGYSPWATLVSEVMLQQTQASRVAPRVVRWLERWPTPADLAAAPASEVLREWDSLGYPRRALALQAAAAAISEQYAGEVPETVEQLLALPGIGDYTARAVLTFALGQRHPVVDTNVRRVLARLVRGDGEAGPPKRSELAEVEALLPQDDAAAVTVSKALMELGAITCVAKTPRCDACPVRDLCTWRSNGYPEYLGKAAPRQSKFAGSDRAARGRILRMLRASEIPVPLHVLAEGAHEAGQHERAIATLLEDGLVVRDHGALALPDENAAVSRTRFDTE
ncbi:A/G-specific adenine glycosylase [Humidisolicoccus flavus]|uniref:A/G-specific adenine glycosylase n=1 Tax=Humidisolicoccus flavus TaxID=3111414 RepID=UPI00324743DE